LKANVPRARTVVYVGKEMAMEVDHSWNYRLPSTPAGEHASINKKAFAEAKA